MNDSRLRRRIAATTYRTLYWAKHHVAPGLRSLLGLLLMVGGVFGFLPVLGFWMFPLGVAFVALDLPVSNRRIELWMMRLARDAELTVMPPAPAGGGSARGPAGAGRPAAERQPTSSQ